MMYGYNGGADGWRMAGGWGGGPEWAFTHWPALAAVLIPVMLILVLWSLVWKGLALWHSGRRGDSWWFVIMLVVNTLGILEIVYLFAIAKLKFHELFSKHDHAHH